MLIPHLGFGIGWRPEIAASVEKRAGTGFVEVVAENIHADAPTPPSLARLQAQGVAVVPHGISLSLGGAEPPTDARINRLAGLAERFGSPFVSEHCCFVRSGGFESGHLITLPRTREALSVLVENLRHVRERLPVPLAIENVATLFEWPEPEMDEADFLAEAAEQADVLLLLDVANLYANARNLGWDPIAFVERLPLERVAYVHVAGGVGMNDGFYHDTHAHAIPREALQLLAEVAAKLPVANILLERDDRFPPEPVLFSELDAIARAVTNARPRCASCWQPAREACNAG